MPAAQGSGPGLGLSPFSCSNAQLAQVMQLCGGNADVATQVCATIDVSAVGPTNAVLQWTVTALAQETDARQQLEVGLNTAFLLTSGYQVFVMQAGFALYAAGVVRAKNVHMILLKNFMDAAIAGIMFYAVGYAFAYGANPNGNTNGFIGNWDFALSETGSMFPQPYANWLWNWAFAAASTTILSGSIAERATFHAYLIYSVFMSVWVYPVVVHWLWSADGWLSAHNTKSILGSGAIDFAGSGVVHMVGGFASIMASWATGPRTGRFDGTLPVTAFKGSSPSLYTLGTFLLWFGWYGFNPGSNLQISTYTLSSAVSRTAVTTTLSGAAGAIAAMLLSWKRTRTWDLLTACTGSLAGMVAVTAGCGVITPWAAIICGFVSAPVYVYGEALMEWLEIDDPVGAFPVHGLCGAWGVLFVGLLAQETYVVEQYNKPYGDHLMGIFYGGHGQLLLCQFIEVLVVAAWSAFWIGGLFFLLKSLGILRVPLEVEAQGMDGVCGHTAQGSINPKSTTKFSSNGVDPSLQLGVVGSIASNPLAMGNNSYKHRPNGVHQAPLLVTITEGGNGILTHEGGSAKNPSTSGAAS